MNLLVLAGVCAVVLALLWLGLCGGMDFGADLAGDDEGGGA